MKSMTMINKDSLVVFFENDRFGKARARAQRKHNDRFKFCRIKSIIQAYPSQIVFGKVYDVNSWNNIKNTWN